MTGWCRLVDPITWPGPFGLVMTRRSHGHVLGFGNGAAPEIIDHSCTGCLCRNEDEMITAVAHVDQIDCRQCPAAAERRFSRSPLAASYDRLCLAILERPGQLTPSCGTR